ncbi:ribonuclease III [Gottschalkia acidurici 9a]|uniref:Ribonuclease 3 n=1 Tax=Gottschalkia acidurici (strain ATCC 7906 / DSM 604 / BCRC 14475 / CIP 104303 / KCTC 5404 / NCIMB 10678 / 9a) TaxID=1128398 RepID=K0B0N7_GOTA9|nr:ribonuclease III [Gottschalkia acidurici]AFS78637.1 ribonuclease III [Gottschalkia acidurici 9a]
MLRKIDTREILLKEIQEKTEYKFSDIHLLNWALTHSSYANEHKKQKIVYNERLEFLGDSILGLVVSEYIFIKYPNYPEGDLTKLRATVVCEPSLSYIARQIDLGKYLLLGKGEEATGGRERVSILADAFEALIGAIYLDGKIESAKTFVLKYLTPVIENAVNGVELFIDHKTHLQELLQKKIKCKIEYRVVLEEGPDHNKIFHTEVLVKDEVLGKGIGKSKKEAEQDAARSAINRMEDNNE